jgi:toxin HigB-1
MIRSFADKNAENLFQDVPVVKFKNLERVVRRKLIFLNQARSLNDLKSPPNNCLEALKGDRAGQYSIRINKQWRLCFVWKLNDAYDVEIVDYH